MIGKSLAFVLQSAGRALRQLIPSSSAQLRRSPPPPLQPARQQLIMDNSSRPRCSAAQNNHEGFESSDAADLEKALRDCRETLREGLENNRRLIDQLKQAIRKSRPDLNI
ncbi:Os03g0636450 [Oryza sativa Japonica Group]|uniref:Os03g0636450 protein n=1 Tax=Oryza sativa subsp. japonica TaxID=39947 RepID=A0A0P0W119_ORYSJ|nr:Os03g0636450 [Oryza sativa Japonica Group]